MLPNWILEFVPRARSMARGEGMLIHGIHAQQVSLSGHQPRSNLLNNLLWREKGVALKNGVPYLCFHTSTQTLHVNRLPGDQKTRSHPLKPRRLLRSASRHSTLIYIEWPALKRKRGVALKNGVPYLCFHTSTQTLHMSVDCQGIRKHAPTLQNRAGFSVWPAAIAL